MFITPYLCDYSLKGVNFLVNYQIIKQSHCFFLLRCLCHTTKKPVFQCKTFIYFKPSLHILHTQLLFKLSIVLFSSFFVWAFSFLGTYLQEKCITPRNNLKPSLDQCTIFLKICKFLVNIYYI